MSSGYTFAIPFVMRAALRTGLFVSLCTIKQPDGVLIDAGQPSGHYIDVDGLQDIACTAPPKSVERLSSEQARTQDDIQSFSPRHVLLGGFYPTIQDGVGNGWIAVIDGEVYTLLGADNDSQGTQTRLNVRQASV